MSYNTKVSPNATASVVDALRVALYPLDAINAIRGPQERRSRADLPSHRGLTCDPVAWAWVYGMISGSGLLPVHAALESELDRILRRNAA